MLTDFAHEKKQSRSMQVWQISLGGKFRILSIGRAPNEKRLPEITMSIILKLIIPSNCFGEN